MAARSGSPGPSGAVPPVSATLFALDRFGWLYALDPTTGAIRWTFQPDLPSPADASPVAAEGLAFVSVANRGLVALRAATGAVHWETSLGEANARHYSHPAFADGLLYVTTWFVQDWARATHAVHAVDSGTGDVRWSREVEGAFIYAPPIVADGVVYVQADPQLQGNRMTGALDAATGTPRWSRPNPMRFGFSAVTTADGCFYFRDHATVYVTDIATGAVRWTAPSHNPNGSRVAPAVADGAVYLDNADGQGALVVRNAATGAILRTQSVSGVTNVTVSHGILYGGVVQTDTVRAPDHTYRVSHGLLVAQDAVTGSRRWSNPAGHYGYSRPLLAGDAVHVAASDNGGTDRAGHGLIMSLHRATGATRWTRNLVNDITVAPTLRTP